MPSYFLAWENRQYANTQTAQIRRNTQEYSAHPARSVAKIFGQYCELVSKSTGTAQYAHTEYANTQAIQICSNIPQAAAARLFWVSLPTPVLNSRSSPLRPRPPPGSAQRRSHVRRVGEASDTPELPAPPTLDRARRKCGSRPT